jgi:membrane protein involved in colicin uptake
MRDTTKIAVLEDVVFGFSNNLLSFDNLDKVLVALEQTASPMRAIRNAGAFSLQKMSSDVSKAISRDGNNKEARQHNQLTVSQLVEELVTMRELFNAAALERSRLDAEAAKNAIIAAKAKADAKAKVDADAKAKVDADAKAKVDADAKALNNKLAADAKNNA